MANIRELRGRIRSVKGIRQITRAMEMVATTKLRRFQERAVRSRPYAREIEALVGVLAAYLAREGGSGEIDLSLISERGDARLAVLLVASDRGLCGAYNSNLFACFEDWRKRNAGKEISVFAIGRKAADYVRKRGYQRAGVFDEVPLEKMVYADVARVAQALLTHFRTGKCDQIHLLSTNFESMAKYVPNATRLLPIDTAAIAAGAITAGGSDAGAGAAAAESAPARSGPILIEPDPAQVLGRLLPRFLETRLFNALMESLTSEYASRRFSMKNATEAADEMIGSLQRLYNRVRQERITKELLEIVGGAEALRG